MALLPSNQSCSPFLDTVDDACLKKVLELLNLRDLCSAAEVCQRFKRNADDVFKSLYTRLNILKLIEGDEDYHDKWFTIRWLSEKFLKSAEQLFRNFGSFIELLRLTGSGKDYGMDDNDLLTLVKGYCSSLKELTLVNIGQDEFSTELVPLFAGLEKLHILNQFGNDTSESFYALFCDCRELQYLSVNGIAAPLWMNKKFPKLETLVIESYWAFDDINFEAFLKLHSKLRTFKLIDNDVFSGHIAAVSNDCPQLEKFCCVGQIEDFDNEGEDAIKQDVLQLSKLKSLKSLTFMCEASLMKLLVDAFVNEHVLLNYLEIINCKIDSELIVGVSKLKSLKTLKLTGCEMVNETFMKLSEYLNELEKVIIKDIEGFNVDDDKVLAQNICFVKSTKNLDQVPYQSSADILNILNDHCLIVIFGFLPLPDLCNVADVCIRFKENSQKVFQLTYTSFDTNEISKTYYTDLQVAEQLFRNFGSFVKNLVLDGHFLKNESEKQTLLYLANRYCSSLSIKQLRLKGIHIEGPMRWILPLFKMFCFLPQLELHQCRLDDDFGIFLSLCQTRSIELYDSNGSVEWMKHSFLYLENMTIIDVFLWQPETTLNEFLKLNGHLTSLVIYSSNLSSKIFKTIPHHIPTLQRFCFAGRNARHRNTAKNLMHLAQLKSLKGLTLDCKSFSVKPLLDELIKETIQIAELSICFGTVDMELLGKLQNLNSLKDLQLRCVKMDNVSLIDLVKKLPKLAELNIDFRGINVKQVIQMLPFAVNLRKLTIGPEKSRVQISIDDYRTILQIVQMRQKVTHLCIVICSETRQVLVPKDILQQSSYWLKVENEIIENVGGIMSDSDSDAETDDDDSASDTDSTSSGSSEEESDNDSDIPVENRYHTD